MIQYCRIGSQVCDSLLNEKHTGQGVPKNHQDTTSYFQYRLNDWQNAIKTRFQFTATDTRTDGWNQQLRTVLHLRANNLRIVIARFFLFEIRAQEGPASLVETLDSSVDVAADTTRVLASMDSSPTTFSFQESQSNYFLIAALGISFFAISQNSPLLGPTSSIKKGISIGPITYQKAQQSALLGLHLLHSRAGSSRQSQRLWMRVRGLASRLNLLGILTPASTPSAGTWEGTAAQASDVSRPLSNHALSGENQELLSWAPPITIDMGMPAVMDCLEDSSSSICDMVSELNAMPNSTFLVNGFDE